MAIPDTIGAINKCIRGYVALVTGLDSNTHVLKANQDMPIPKLGLFSSILITPIDSVGIDAVTYNDDVGLDLIETRCGVREFRASINFYRANAMNYAYAIQGSAYEAANIEYLSACGIGFVRTSTIRDLTAVELSRYEERAQLDFFFNVIAENENTVSSIQSAEIDGTLEADGNTYDIEIEVT